MQDIYVLGAIDPEMARIEEVLGVANACVVYAKKNGQRVHAGNAYEADNGGDVPEDSAVIFIECGIVGVTPAKMIDHHRPIDPGYHKGPTEYWEASSLGQLHDHLGLKPTRDDYVLAAMDHCYNAAMKGACPGVSRKDVLARKIHQIALATRRTSAEVEAMVDRYRNSMTSSSQFLVGGQQVIDVPESTGIGYTLEYLCAQVSATLLQAPVVLHLQNEEGAPERLHLCGDVWPSTAAYFMETWGPSHGLTNIYGSPERGYAGGYRGISPSDRALSHRVPAHGT